MLTDLSTLDDSCQPKKLQLKQIQTFRQIFLHQIMLQTFSYPDTMRNESNIILKTYESPIGQW